MNTGSQISRATFETVAPISEAEMEAVNRALDQIDDTDLVDSRTSDFSSSESNTQQVGWPGVWELFGFLLSHKVRERLYMPAVNELLRDYLAAKRYHSKWALRWLDFCFFLRTALLAIDCIRAAGIDKLASYIIRLIPTPWKRWWIS